MTTQIQQGIDAAKEAGKFAVKTSEKAIRLVGKAKLDNASLFSTYAAAALLSAVA